MDIKTVNSMLAHLLFQAFRAHVETFSNSPTVGAYTPHGVPHILGVEESVRYIIKHHGYAGRHQEMKPIQPLLPLEILLLRFCAWGHDLGMIQSVAEEYWHAQPEKIKKDSSKDEFLRKHHDKASAEHISRILPKLFAEVVAELRGGRHKDGKMEKSPQECRDLYAGLLARLMPDSEEKEILTFLDLVRDDQSAGRRMSAEVTTLAYTVNLIARYHRRAEPIAECPEERCLLGNTIRTKLLAAIFRMADALNVDRTRFEKDPFNLFRVLPEFTEENRVHWIKSFIVSAIRFDLRQHTVHIQADLPLGPDEQKASLHEMLMFIVVDLEEDVLSVARILLQHDFPPLLGVTYEVHEIPAMEYQEDIKAVLDNVYASASPNTSQQITIALKRLDAGLHESETKPDMSAYLQQHVVPDLLKHLRHQLEIRPCHEGLRKIEDLLAVISKLWAEESRRSVYYLHVIHSDGSRIRQDRLLWTLVEGVKEVFLQQRERVEGKNISCQAFSKAFDASDHIVVYGFSQQVVHVLQMYLEGVRDRKERLPAVHVLECRTKTIYSSSGRLIYLDGQRYAKALRDKLPEEVEITLEPDVAVGRIVKRAKQGTSVVLGSNAVYSDGTFVHSMGHISVAAIAKATELAKTRVIVVTDGMKIGNSPNEEERERHPDVWLTHNREILDEIKKKRIILHNWREDRVPRKLIDDLIILDAEDPEERIVQLNSNAAQDGSLQILEKLRFNARRAYAQTLEQRLLAAVITHSQERPQYQDVIAHFTATASPFDRNWILAEKFLQNKSGLSDPQEASAAAVLYPWLDSMWGEEQREAVKILCHEIDPTWPYARRVEPRGGGS
jgi:translation initiation factor 2B subunit (eIF-2B alpha/beta/delta family)